MPLQPNQVLRQRYQIRFALAQGGMGAVYRALDLNLGRECAVKENLETAPAAQVQFQREAQILAHLRHPHLPQVFDYFIDPNGRQYLVMEFVEGEDLRARAQRVGVPTEAQALKWIIQVLDALEYLHTRTPPVIHRDIKPANIRVTSDGNAMLVDFGIAKVWTAGLATTRGARAVTAGYSPVEQYGQGTTDTRSDIYALGATLYFLLTATEPLESVQRMAGASFKPPRMINPAISPPVEKAVLRAMELLPQNRYQFAHEMRGALIAAPAPLPAAPARVPVPVKPPPAALVSSVQPPSASASALEKTQLASVPVSRPAQLDLGYVAVPAVVGNVLNIGLSLLGALGLTGITGGLTGSGTDAETVLGALSLLSLVLYCAAVLLIPLPMGAWAAQRSRRVRGGMSFGQALLDGTLAGFLTYLGGAVIGVCVALARLGDSNAAGMIGSGLIELGIGIVLYGAFGGLGGIVYRAVSGR